MKSCPITALLARALQVLTADQVLMQMMTGKWQRSKKLGSILFGFWILRLRGSDPPDSCTIVFLLVSPLINRGSV